MGLSALLTVVEHRDDPHLIIADGVEQDVWEARQDEFAKSAVRRDATKFGRCLKQESAVANVGDDLGRGALAVFRNKVRNRVQVGNRLVVPSDTFHFRRSRSRSMASAGAGRKPRSSRR